MVPLSQGGYLMGVLIRTKGLVQGIGFRPFVYRIAVKHGLKGYVRNVGDGTVEIFVEGGNIEGFLKELKNAPLSQIEKMDIREEKDRGYENFVIEKSTGERKEKGAIVPPDIAICDECLREMYDGNNRRYRYFFITCTHCGPRYTIIRKLPYDRGNTTMDEFAMCEDCEKEYKNPVDRRYHAQTVACGKCGPEIFLVKDNAIIEKGEEAIGRAAKEIEQGHIVAIKGIGGFHLAVDAQSDEAVGRLREIYGRPSQPFAVMVRDIDSAERIAHIDDLEKKLLTSFSRPIVVLRKKGEKLSRFVSPGLHTIGVMLPYTGLHHLLFDHLETDAIVMTSANHPGNPILKDEEEMNKIDADCFLIHNRKIHQRCDDSVIKVVNGKASFLRRSRGYVPLPLDVHINFKRDVAALGPELDVTICLMTGNKAILSQYIGDTSKYDTLEYLKDCFQHLCGLLGVEPSVIACDLNPAFETSQLAREIAEEKEIEVIEVQHHFAHAASLIGEHGLDESICIAIDGYGYGLDGQAWGGEIIYAGRDFKRMGHIEYFPLLGGDRATYYPLRVVAGILGKKVEDWLIERKDAFPHGEREIEVMLRQKGNILTSSCGRFLDGISALLDICHYRSYEGEPAMKLEAVAASGKEAMEIEPEIKGDKIVVKEIFEEIFENLKRYRREDLAFTAQKYIATSLAELAIEKADSEGVKNIGISGGCAYNDFITTEIARRVKREGLNFYQNEKVPCGDGGVSFGQGIYCGIMRMD